jgi:uncharacterized protein
METVLLAAALVAYNNLANLWPPFNGALYVPVNVLSTTVLIALALGPLGLAREDMGLGQTSLGHLLVGLGMGAAVALPVLVAALLPATRRLVKDNRVRDLSAPGLLYQAAVRVPLGTALLEEVAFRGVLVGAWLHLGSGTAALLSSIAFGLWHIMPTRNMMLANNRRQSVGPAVAGAVVFTFAAGLLLTWLRFRTGGLAAPLGLHAAVNALGTLGAWLAHRLAS